MCEDGGWGQSCGSELLTHGNLIVSPGSVRIDLNRIDSCGGQISTYLVTRCIISKEFHVTRKGDTKERNTIGKNPIGGK